MGNVDLLTSDDIWDIHEPSSVGQGLSIEDTRLSQKVPIVVNYSLIDLESTEYNFKQEFSRKDTQKYFEVMSNIASRSIDEIIDSGDRTLHFYRTKITRRMVELMKRLDRHCKPDAESTIVYHFALYTDKNGASRESGRRSPRIYFMLGKNGMIYPLFFDPYHEINPMQV